MLLNASLYLFIVGLCIIICYDIVQGFVVYKSQSTVNYDLLITGIDNKLTVHLGCTGSVHVHSYDILCNKLHWK